MALWLDLKLGKDANPKPLIEVHMDDVETVAQVMNTISALMKSFGLA